MYTAINLCCGAGGMSLGFHMAGVRVLLGIDLDETAVQTFKVGPARLADIQESLILPEANIVFGSVPGAGVSLLNSRSRGVDMGDPRNSLPYHFMIRALACRPDAIVMDGLQGTLKSPAFEQARRMLQVAGYHTQVGVLDAASYGVPQHRKHAVLLAVRGASPAFPLPTHTRPVTVRMAISDLPLDASAQDFAFPRKPDPVSLERYKVVGPGENWTHLKARRPEITPACWLRRQSGGTDVFGRLCWDQPALKIRNEFYKPEKGCYLHPEADRPITHREAARLQSFPDWYEIKGNQAKSGVLIGNAVPPLFGKAIAEAVVGTLETAGIRGRG